MNNGFSVKMNSEEGINDSFAQSEKNRQQKPLPIEIKANVNMSSDNPKRKPASRSIL